MSDYALVRTRSAIIRSSDSPSLLVSRTYSVPDLTAYVRAGDRYKPTWYYWPYYSWSSYYYPYYSSRSSWPYRYYRDYSIGDSYWYDRYYYFSPLYYRSLYPRRYYYSDYISNPYYWSAPYNYWTRYKSYYYDYDYPYYYRRWYDSYYDSYLRSYRYRSWLTDSMSDSLAKGLALYRNGTISFNQLDRNWLTSNSWHSRFKDYRTLYLWDKEAQKREPFSAKEQYTAEWVT